MPLYHSKSFSHLYQLLKAAIFAFTSFLFTTHPAAAGALTGTNATAPASINLTTQGSADWTHWGLSSVTSFNRKSGVTQQISNYTLIGTTAPSRFQAPTGARVTYAWSDGTPTASTSGTRTGLFVNG